VAQYLFPSVLYRFSKGKHDINAPMPHEVNGFHIAALVGW
jgi:hypothetical protein